MVVHNIAQLANAHNVEVVWMEEVPSHIQTSIYSDTLNSVYSSLCISAFHKRNVC